MKKRNTIMVDIRLFKVIKRNPLRFNAKSVGDYKTDITAITILSYLLQDDLDIIDTTYEELGSIFEITTSQAKDAIIVLEKVGLLSRQLRYNGLGIILHRENLLKVLNGESVNAVNIITEGYVYFIKDIGGYIKIGKTTNISKRLGKYITENANVVHTIYMIHYNNIDYGVAERTWHKYFAHKKYNRERFKLDEEDITYIKGFSNNELPNLYYK